MATATFRHDGAAIDYTPGAAVSAGDVVVQGELIGVAKLDIAANALGALAVQGVFDFPKATGVGTAITVGSRVYGDTAARGPASANAKRSQGPVHRRRATLDC